MKYLKLYEKYNEDSDPRFSRHSMVSSNVSFQLEEILDEILPPMCSSGIQISALKDDSKIRKDNPDAICLSIRNVYKSNLILIKRSEDHWELIEDFNFKEVKVFPTLKDVANYIGELSYREFNHLRPIKL